MSWSGFSKIRKRTCRRWPLRTPEENGRHLAALFCRFILQRRCGPGQEGLAKAGTRTRKIPDPSKVSPGSIDSIAVLGFAVSSLVDQMRSSKNGRGSAQIDVDEILEILGPSETTARSLDEDELPLGLAPEIFGTIDQSPLEALDGTGENAGFSNLASW